MRNFRLTIFLILLMSWAFRMSAFVRYDIPNQTSRDISRITQDSQGFIWIGTNNGLNRFDGWTNVTFTHNQEDPTSLKSNIVEALFNDSEGNLWVASGAGLQRYVVGKQNFQNVIFPDDQKPSVRSIIERSKDELLLVTSGYGAFSIDTKTMKATPMESLNKTFGSRYAHVIRMDPLNRIWIGGADNRLVAVDRNLNKIYSTTLPERILEIAADKDKGIYIATDFNIYRWNATDQKFEKLNSDQDWKITGMTTDSKGDILVHTLESGVFRISNAQLNSDDTYSQLKDEGISVLYEDNDGDMWIGTRRGSLAMSSNKPEMFTFRDIPTAPSINIETLFVRSFGPGVAVALSDGRIVAFDPDLNQEASFQSRGRVTSSCRLNDGTILLGNADGTIMKYSNNSVEPVSQPSTYEITALAEDKSGRLYAALQGKGFAFREGGGDWIHITAATPVTGSVPLGNDWINVITADQTGKIWMGHHNGIDLFDPSNKKFTETKSIEALRSHIVYAILQAKDNTVWIGTNNGLYHLYPEEDKLDFYGIREGMTGNIICGIQQANNGDIWCTTNNGISRIRYSDNKVINYLSGNGLGERDYKKGMLMQGPGDKLFAVGFNGITSFYPDTSTDSYVPAAPVLTRVYLNNKNEGSPEILYHPQGNKTSATVKLKYFQNTFSLDFSNFNYSNPGGVYFEYRITSLDKEWKSNPIGDNSVVCNYMNPGKYILEVRAVENGLYSPVSSIQIEILPPWYLTVWAKIIYFALIVILAGAMWHFMKRQRQQKKNEEIAEEKFKLLYNFAHELRSPVTLITSPLTSMIDGEKDERKANTLRMIQRNGYRITNLVNQMLDARRIEKGQLTLSFAETDLKEYIEQIIRDFHTQAENRRISLSFNTPDGAVRAYIDQDNFDKVIVNLLSNAFKFTPDGGSIEVTLKKTTDSNGRAMARVEIADTGTGISTEDIPHIFDRFYQADRKRKGFGIGLNLSKMLVELHHGKISAANRVEGSGACFEVTIPLGRNHLKDKEITDSKAENAPKKYIEAEESMPSPTESDDKKGNRQYRVLAVDDDDEIRQYLKRELGSSYRILTAADGEEAYSIALDKQIDLIISDIRMPKADGFELLRKIRSNADLAHIPIILLTTSEDFKTRMTGWEKGADGYLTKPFRIEELRQLCSSLISGRIRLKGRFSNGEKIEENIQKVEVKGNDELLLERITKAINENIGDSEFGVEQLAETVGLSRVHLHRKMKALLGLAPRDFLKSVRLKRAAELLKKRSTNISQVGYSVGFSSPGQFSESFRKYFGCSPSEYLSRQSDEEEANDGPTEATM